MWVTGQLNDGSCRSLVKKCNPLSALLRAGLILKVAAYIWIIKTKTIQLAARMSLATA